MKTIDKYLNNREFILYTFSIVALLVFRQPIEEFLSITLVKYIFGIIHKEILLDITLFSFAFYLLILNIVRKIRKYTPSIHIIIILILSSITYLLYRNFSTSWVFTSFSITEKLKYFDILIFASLCNLIPLRIKWNHSSKNNEDNKNSFIIDEPIGEHGIDRLGYDTYAKYLAEKINSSHFEKAFAIGINGKWGSGKTSFIDLVKREFKNNDDVIEIEFNPWNSDSPKAIIIDFFETLQYRISKEHSSISRHLFQYSKKLVELNSNTVTQSIQTTVTALTGFETLSSLRENINDALRQIDKKVIIYIDDLDRLDKDEIMEVIRLIRNTANFYNTFFIVAYDRSYVVKAIEQQNPYNQNAFLEKIFQLEISMPYYKKYKLRNKLAEMLTSKMDIDNHVIDKYIRNNDRVLDDWLENMRDVTRLSNVLFLNYSRLMDEVVFHEFMYVETLRIKHPQVYELLYKRKIDFLSEGGKDHKGRIYYQLNNKAVLGEIINKYIKPERVCIEDYLDKSQSELVLSDYDFKKVMDLLTSIFYFDKNRINSSVSIIYPSKFDRYFVYELTESDLSKIDFSKARAHEQIVFNSSIAEWVTNGLEDEVLDMFREIKDFDNSEDFEKLVNALFFLANCTSRKYSGIVQYWYNNFEIIIGSYMGELSDGIYEDNRYKVDFLQRVFKSANSPYVFESRFIEYLNGFSHEPFKLNKSELSKIVIDYLRIYCSCTCTFNSTVISLFNCCKQNEWKTEGNVTSHVRSFYSDEAKSVLKKFIFERDLTGYLEFIIHAKSDDENVFAIHGRLIEVFDTWENFAAEIRNVDSENNAKLDEFKNFLSAFEEKKFKEHVSFQFDKLNIKRN
jgi:hypothetical protein